MSLISRLLQAAQSWRRRRGGPKTAKRSAVTVEQLDHRQLLSVNFTGNVAIDFPATQQPGVVIFNSSNSSVITPMFPATPQGAALKAAIPVEGFTLSEIRVSYDSTTDTLDIGLNQPNYPSTGTPVIAGDADGNGDAGTVNLNVLAIDPFFTEYYSLGGTDEMAAYLDLADSGTPDVIAGFSPNAPMPNPPIDQSPQKPYEVATAIPSGNPLGVPAFGDPIDNNLFAGNYYLQNSAAHPNFEFSISHFSELYQAETGKVLTPSTVIGIGATAGSADIGGISDAVIQENTFTLSQATLPVAPELSPPILINPHEHRIIDTDHRDLIRVSIFGTSGFPVSEINPATVELDGVHAIAHITRKVHRDEFPFQTYVFVGNQLTLPAGLTTATLTGDTYSGFPFQTQKDVLNIKDSAKVFGQLKKYMGNASYYERLVKIETRNPSTVISVNNTPVTAVSRNRAPKGAAAIKVDYTPKVSPAGKVTTAAESVKVRPVVSIKHGDAALERSTVPVRLRHSMNDYLN
jgi:hypothetical protein